MSRRMVFLIAALGLCLFPAEGRSQQVRADMGPAVLAARQALSAKDYAGALAKLDETNALPDHSMAEDLVIGQLRIIAAIGLRQPGRAADVVSTLDAAHALAPGQDQSFSLAIARNYFDTADYQSSLIWARRYLAAGGPPEAIAQLELQALYRTNAVSEALRLATAAVEQAEARHSRPSEDILQIAADCAHRQGDQTVYASMMEKLAIGYPKPAYWAVLISAIEHQSDFPDHLTLEIVRLKLRTGVPLTQAHYVDAIERAVQSGLPWEAKQILDDGFARHILGTGDQKERHARLQTLVDEAIAAKSARQDVQFPATANSADEMANTALNLAGSGRQTEAIALMEAAISAGQLTHPSEVHLHLGLLYIAYGNVIRAKQLFTAETGDDLVAKLAHIWKLTLEAHG